MDEKVSSMIYNSSCSLVQRQRLALDSGFLADCDCFVGTGNEKSRFRCHSLMLALASPRLRDMMTEKGREKEILLPEESPCYFPMILEFVYTDAVSSLDDMETTCEVGFAAARLSIASLVQYCITRGIELLDDKNVTQAFYFAHYVQPDGPLYDLSWRRIEEMSLRTQEMNQAQSKSAVTVKVNGLENSQGVETLRADVNNDLGKISHPSAVNAESQSSGSSDENFLSLQENATARRNNSKSPSPSNRRSSTMNA